MTWVTVPLWFQKVGGITPLAGSHGPVSPSPFVTKLLFNAKKIPSSDHVNFVRKRISFDQNLLYLSKMKPLLLSLKKYRKMYFFHSIDRVELILVDTVSSSCARANIDLTFWSACNHIGSCCDGRRTCSRRSWTTMVLLITYHARLNISIKNNTTCSAIFAVHRTDFLFMIVHRCLTIIFILTLPNTCLHGLITWESIITNESTGWSGIKECLSMNPNGNEWIDHGEKKENGETTHLCCSRKR